MASLNVSFTIVYCVTIPFLLLPAVWHWRVGNTALLLLIFWLLVTCVPQAINSIIFLRNTADVAPVWCDITTKLRIGADVGLAVASLCITLQLWSIAAARQVLVTSNDRRHRDRLFLMAGLGLPVLTMVLHVVVQGHRYDVLPVVGCTPTVYYSGASLAIINLPPVILLSVSAIYAGITIRLFVARRYQFSRLLESSKSALTTPRFLRLVGLAVLQIAFMLPMALTIFITSLVDIPLNPYISWADVHYGFNTVLVVTKDELYSFKPTVRRNKELALWLPAILAILFFAFFGLGEESLAVYRHWVVKILSRCHHQHASLEYVTALKPRRLGLKDRKTDVFNCSHEMRAPVISVPSYSAREPYSCIELSSSSNHSKIDMSGLSSKGVVVTVEKEASQSV
ncbi:BQ5605_C043g12112 [Microbotryum silenes-dioicae]|uniref:BQ5605_C043g12112 protein n=1 Tax=Microbotryum silenes-dioicae TaxID=796604 RepID=A0A2X0MTF2_9BASI|nr:BQ5605_C043g12112 [Microbotryum silenes-dioicae]